MNESIVRGISRAEAGRAAADLGQSMGHFRHPLIQTSDATPTVIASLEIEDNTAGIIEINIVGMDDAGTGAVTQSQRVRFIKLGTLTLGTPSNVLALEDDLTIGGITYVTTSADLEVEVTGIAATVINWEVTTKILFTTSNGVAP